MRVSGASLPTERTACVWLREKIPNKKSAVKTRIRQPSADRCAGSLLQLLSIEGRHELFMPLEDVEWSQGSEGSDCAALPSL